MPYEILENEEDPLSLESTAPTQRPDQESIPGPGAPVSALASALAPAQQQDIAQPQSRPEPTQPEPVRPEQQYSILTDREWNLPEPLERGFTGDVLTAAGRGIGRAVEATGAGVETMGAGTTGSFWKKKGREMAESKTLRPDDTTAAGGDSAIKRTFLSAVESLPRSLVPLATGALGAAAGSLAGPGGAIYGAYAGGAAGLGTTVAAGTFGLAKERYLKEKAGSGLPKEQLEADANDFAMSQTLWETIPEAASDLVAAGTFGVSKLLMSGLVAAGAKTTLKGLLSQGPKAFAAQFGKAYLKSMPVEALSEMVTYWGQATGEKEAGIGDGPIAQGFIDAAATSVWMTAMMGGGMAAYSQRAKNRIAKAIQSDNPVMRSRAADRIQEGLLKEYGPERAQEWRDSVEKTFQSGGKIDMTSPVFQAAQEPSAREKEAKAKPEGVLTRALSMAGESVEAGTEIVSPEQIAKMEQENVISGKIAAGIPLTEEEEYARYSPAAPVPIAEVGPEQRFTERVGKEVSSAIPTMMRDLASAVAGKRIKSPEPKGAPYHAEAGATVRQPSSFPAWVTRDKVISKAGKNNIEKIVARAIAGEEGSFTPRQAELWEKIKSAAKEEYNTNPELVAGQEADKLIKEGFDLGVTEDISVGSLNPGDEVVVTDATGVPGKLTHKGFDADGNAIMKDGVTMKVDPFEQISVIGKKIGPEGEVVSRRMVDFITKVNAEENIGTIKELMKETPGMLAKDKSLAPYADMVKGSLERRLAELEPDRTKVAGKEKKEVPTEVAKKDKLSERAKKRGAVKEISKDSEVTRKQIDAVPLADVPEKLYHGTSANFEGQPTGKYSEGGIFYANSHAAASYATAGGSSFGAQSRDDTGATFTKQLVVDIWEVEDGTPVVYRYNPKSEKHVPWGFLDEYGTPTKSIDGRGYFIWEDGEKTTFNIDNRQPLTQRDIDNGDYESIEEHARIIEYTPPKNTKLVDAKTKEGAVYLREKAKGIAPQIYHDMDITSIWDDQPLIKWNWRFTKNIRAAYSGETGRLYSAVANDGFDGIFFTDDGHDTWMFFDKDMQSAATKKTNKVAKKDKLSERAKKREGKKESPQEAPEKKTVRPVQKALEDPGAKQKINVTSAGEKTNATAKIVGEWLSVFESQTKRPVDIKVLTRQEAAAGLSDINVIPEGLKKIVDSNKGILSGESAAALKWSDKSGKYVIIAGDVEAASKNFSSKWALMELSGVAHEVGHVIEEEFLAGASNETRAAMFQAHRAWHKENKGDILSGKLLNEKRFPAGMMGSQRQAGEGFDTAAEVMGIPLPEYLLSFSEWFANETAKALTSSAKPINAVEKFFADLADVMRKLAAKIVGTDFVPDAAVANFVLGGDMLIDDKVAAAEGNKPADTDSINLLYAPAAPTSPRVKAMLDEAKAGPSEEKYVRRFEGKSNETSVRYAARHTKAMISDAGDTVDKFLGAISSRLRKWSPETEKALRRMEIDILQDTSDYTAAVEPLMEAAKAKMTPRDYSDWGLARHDSDKKKIDYLIEKYNLESEYKAARKVIERMGQLLNDAGFDIGNIEEYWPRVVKDTQGLLRHMERGDMRPVFSDALKVKAKQMGIKVSALTDEDRAKVASSVILGRSYGMSGPGSSKERVFESIPEELVQYYFDPDAAMIAHIRSVVETAAYRKFFGRTGENMAVVRKRLEKVEKSLASKDISAEDRVELEDVATELRQTLARNEQGDFTQSVGVLVAGLEAQGLPAEGQKEIRDTLMARFHERGATGAIRAYKNLSLIDTMGSYASAITQIGDFASPMYNAGMYETGRALGKAITGKQRISSKELGLDDIAEEFTDPGKIGAAVNKIFSLTGLNYMNRIARDTFLNSAFEQFKKEATTDSAKLKAKIKPMFLHETDSVVQDLLNDDITDNVRYLVIDRLLDFQPITKSEASEKYLTAGNGRLFFSLKSYQLKQFDLYRREIVTGLKSDSKQERIDALKNMTRLGMFLVLANASADELKDFLLGRESTLQDRVVDNILRLGGISRFVTWQARREGVGSAAAKQILPPIKLPDALAGDIYSFGDDKGFKSLDSVPLVGKLAYWRLGQGAEKKHDIWEIRYIKEKQRISKFEDRLEKAKDKKEFISENRDDFILSRRIKKFQSRLNRNKKLINKLESLEPSKKIHARIDLLKDRRSEMTRKFLGRM